jgi:predicted Mrr-cat superfamily restriction endonuclease
MCEGDRVLTYDPAQWRYAVGTITSGYRHDSSMVEGKQHVRPVQWDRRPVSRDDLTPAARKTLASSVSVFMPARATAREIAELLEARRE